MQSTDEVPTTTYQHLIGTLQSTDNISPLKSGNIFTDIVLLSDNTPQAQNRPRMIRCVKHPLADRDGTYIASIRSRRLSESLRDVLVEVNILRASYWETQPIDHQRFGRKEAMAREHSIKVVGLAIKTQENKERRNRPVKWTRLCDVM
jgi:hypothetical protein